MQKTLGGDRLGAGKKQQIELHGYERSTHDLGYLWRSTMSAGTLVPFMCQVALPGDTFDIDLNAMVMTHPTVGPLFGSYKVQLDVFQAPIRLYNALLHNNALKIGLDMSVVKFPILRTYTGAIAIDNPDLDNSQINPSCLLSYLGIRGIGITDVAANREFNGVPLLAYWDIYKNYYANKQEEIGAVIHSPYPTIINTVDTIVKSTGGADTTIPAVPATPIPMFTGDVATINFTGTQPLPEQIILNTVERGEVALTSVTNDWTLSAPGVLSSIFNFTGWWTATVTNWRYIGSLDLGKIPPEVATFPLDNIDQMRESILSQPSRVAPFDIEATNLEPYIWMSGNQALSGKWLGGSQEGLALKTYQSDLFNNWLQTEWIDGVDGINSVTAIDTSGGSFTLDTLRLANKVNEMLNRIAVSGGTYDDWLDAVWTHDRYKRAETPMYMGGLSKELIFQEVISNSQTEQQPLGTLAGRGVMAQKHKGGHIVIKVDEPSYIIGIISLTPRLDYSQGNSWDINLRTLNDLHKPALDEIGFQELITEQMAWWDTEYNSGLGEWVQRSAGKQPAWINYMTNVNQTRGNFAVQNNEMFMTLNRRYTPNTNSLGFRTIEDLTTYIDPSKFNFIFAETALDSQNFWTQVSVDITARRKMSAKVMPNL